MVPPFSLRRRVSPGPADQRKKRWKRGAVQLILLACRW